MRRYGAKHSMHKSSQSKMTCSLAEPMQLAT